MLDKRQTCWNNDRVKTAALMHRLINVRPPCPFFTLPPPLRSNKGGGQIKLAPSGKVRGKAGCCGSLSAEVCDETLEDNALWFISVIWERRRGWRWYRVARVPKRERQPPHWQGLAFPTYPPSPHPHPPQGGRPEGAGGRGGGRGGGSIHFNAFAQPAHTLNKLLVSY